MRDKYARLYDSRSTLYDGCTMLYDGFANVMRQSTENGCRQSHCDSFVQSTQKAIVGDSWGL